MDKAFALPASTTEVIFNSIVESIRKVLGRDNLIVSSPELVLSATEIEADSLDCTEIIIQLESIWGVALPLDRSPTWGYLNVRIEDLKQAIAYSLQKLFKINNLNNEFVLLRTRVRLAVFSALQRIVEPGTLDDESTTRGLLNDKSRLIGGLYMSSDQVAVLERFIMENLSTNIKLNLIKVLDRFGDISVSQLCWIVYRTLVYGGHYTPKKSERKK